MGLFKKLAGITLSQFRIRPAANPGAPTTGFHLIGEEHVDSVGARFFCTASGTPGTWATGGGGKPASIVLILEGDSSGPSEVVLGQSKVFSFDSGSVKGAVASFHLPSEVALAAINPTVEFIVYCTSEDDGATNADALFRLTCRYIAIGELITQAAAETLTELLAIIDTQDERQAQLLFTLDRTLIAEADHLEFHLERVGDDVTDDYEGSVGPPKSLKFNFTTV